MSAMETHRSLPRHDLTQPRTPTASEPAPPENEIRLQSDAHSTPMAPSKDLIEIFQVDPFHSASSHYAIFDSWFLSIHIKRPFKKARRHWLNLAFLDPTPHLLTLIDRRSLYAAIGSSAVTLIMLLVGSVMPTLWSERAWAETSILMLATSVIAFYVFFQRSRSLVRFHSRHGDVVMLELSSHLPSRQEFREFLQALIQRIQAAHRLQTGKPHQKLGAELCEHRRLKDAGVLTQDAYDSAREKILRRYRQANSRPSTKPKIETRPVILR
jgi:hypothetical protein